MSGVITAGAAAWCLFFALALHVFVAGRVGDRIPAVIGQEVIPRGVTTLTLAGLAGLTVVTVGAWLHSATTAAAGWMLTTLHIPLVSHVVVGALALFAAVSAITRIVGGHAISGLFMAECVLAAALLAAIPGHAGQFLSALIRAAVRAGAFVVGQVFGVI